MTWMQPGAAWAIARLYYSFTILILVLSIYNKSTSETLPQIKQSSYLLSEPFQYQPWSGDSEGGAVGADHE